jgi:hypothetical protein
MNRAAERGNEFWLKKTLEVELEEKRQKANKVCFYIEVLLCDVGGCGKKGKRNKCKGEVGVCVVTAHRCNAIWWDWIPSIWYKNWGNNVVKSWPSISYNKKSMVKYQNTNHLRRFALLLPISDCFTFPFFYQLFIFLSLHFFQIFSLLKLHTHSPQVVIISIVSDISSVSTVAISCHCINRRRAR